MTLLDAHRSESDLVASLQLPQLPQVRFDDGHRADESAQAGSVRPQDYRHVAGEIHRADRIRVVVDVGRVQPRLAAIGTHPFGFGADQAHAGAAGVEMHFPVGREKPLDVRFSKVFRGGMRAVNDPHPAHVCQRFKCLIGNPLPRTALHQGHDVQHIAGAQRATAMTAELAEGKGTFAAQIIRHVEPAAHAQIASHTGTCDGAQRQRRTGAHE